MKRRIALMLAITLAAAALASSGAKAKKPKLTPGVDPGGVTIAILTVGIDYTRPDVAAQLARDGEGELIGWDMVDGDNRPYLDAKTGDRGARETEFVATIGAAIGARFIPLRISADQPTIPAAVSFLAQTPARIVLTTKEDMANLPPTRSDLIFLVLETRANVINLAGPRTQHRPLYLEAGDPRAVAEILRAVRDCPAPAGGETLDIEKKLMQLKSLLLTAAPSGAQQRSPVDCTNRMLLRRSPSQ